MRCVPGSKCEVIRVNLKSGTGAVFPHPDTLDDLISTETSQLFGHTAGAQRKTKVAGKCTAKYRS